MNDFQVITPIVCILASIIVLTLIILGKTLRKVIKWVDLAGFYFIQVCAFVNVCAFLNFAVYRVFD